MNIKINISFKANKLITNIIIKDIIVITLIAINEHGINIALEDIVINIPVTINKHSTNIVIKDIIVNTPLR